MSDVTRVLTAIEQGDPQAAQQLLPLVYDELRKLAAARLAQEKPGQTLQATALVHEAYLRLVGGERRGVSPGERRGVSPTCDGNAPHFNSRGHFFAAAAEAMRRILIDQARRRKAAKRGGQAQREELHESAIAAGRPIEELLAVDELLERLAEVDPAAANLVKLRFFVGLNMSEVAEAMGISVRTAHDIWAYARTWLHQAMAAE
jgi:RNA polymerase sigma factor (sigma-70 family)